MTNKLTPYPLMKDSGVKWLGQIPEPWKIKRGKWLFRHRKDINTGGVDTNVLSLTLRGVVNNDPENPEGLVPKDYATYQTFCKGDLVFKLIDLENLRTSRVGLVHENGIMSSAYVRLTPTSNLNIRFFYQTYFDLYQRGIYNQLGAGVRSTLGPSDLLELKVLIPPPPEQAAIVKYLDYLDRRIKKLIAAKKKLIKLIEEQKQTVIHQTVTKGLDPDVPMKDSGLKWLGKVPGHWEVRRNGRLFTQRNETGYPKLPILEVSLRTGIRVRDFKNSDRKQVMSNRNAYKRAVKGDIAYNMMRMWQGAVGIAPEDGLISPAYVVARPLSGTNVKYFEKLFRTSVYMQEIDNFSRGIVKDRNRLYWEDFKAMPSCYPPPAEQIAIVRYLNQVNRDGDLTISRAKSEIELLREYRTCLISDVVTGKLDVREAAASLPDEDYPIETGLSEELNNEEFDDNTNNEMIED